MRILNSRTISRAILTLVVATIGIAAYGCGGSGSLFSSSVIGSSGGTLTSADGRLTLNFPPNALAADTTISITSVSLDELPTGWLDAIDVNRIYRLEPEGQVFAVPVSVSIKVPGSEDDAPASFMATSSDGQAILPEMQSLELDLDSGQVTLNARINHFSQVWDNLPREGGVRVRFSGIPAVAPVGERVFTATATITQPATSQIRADAVFFDDDNSSSPISLTSRISLLDDDSVNLGALDANRAQVLNGSLDYDCQFQGTGVYRGKVEFGLYNLGNIFASVGIITIVENRQPDLVYIIEYSSKASRTVRCGSPVVTPTITPEPTPTPDTSDPTTTPTAETTPADPTPTPEPICDQSEKVCQNTNQAPGCIADCKCDDGFPIGNCNAVCLDTGAAPTQCDPSGIGCPGNAALVCPV